MEGGSNDDRGPPIRKSSSRFRLTIVVIIVAAIGVLGYFAYSSGFLLGTPTSTEQSTTQPGGASLMTATCSSVSNMTRPVQQVATGGNGSHVYFLIVEADPPSPFAGINGSYYVSTTTQWPTLEVQLGQVVSIHVINCASSEAHGFQVQYYDDKEVIVVPTGESYNVTFTANKAGTFRIYCDIFCAIHPFMQNGALVVS